MATGTRRPSSPQEGNDKEGIGKPVSWLYEKRLMEDDEPLTHTCKNCGALIYYTPCEVPEGTLLGLVANCPECGAIIPELGGATIIAFGRAERAEDDERRH